MDRLKRSQVVHHYYYVHIANVPDWTAKYVNITISLEELIVVGCLIEGNH